MNKTLKKLSEFIKSLLSTIKEKQERKKLDRILDDPEWLKAIYEANKGFLLEEDIDVSEQSTVESLFVGPDLESARRVPETMKGSGIEEIVEDINFDKVDVANRELTRKNPPKEDRLNSPDEVKEAYFRIRNGDDTADSYSGVDLLRLFAFMTEELHRAEDSIDDEEIEEENQ